MGKNRLYFVLDFLFVGLIYFLFASLVVIPTIEYFQNISTSTQGKVVNIGLLLIFIVEVMIFKMNKGMFFFNRQIIFFDVCRLVFWGIIAWVSLEVTISTFSVFFRLATPGGIRNNLAVMLLNVPVSLGLSGPYVLVLLVSSVSFIFSLYKVAKVMKSFFNKNQAITEIV